MSKEALWICRCTLTIAAASKRGYIVFVKGCIILREQKTLLRLLLHRKATTGANLNMAWQREDEVKMLKCLPTMDEIERRAESYVSINGTYSDLSIAVAIIFWGKIS